jgi:adenylate kinase
VLSTIFTHFLFLSHTTQIIKAFAPVPTFSTRSITSTTTELEACRVNAKKEKRIRNRDNMRKFKKRGKISRKKMMRKLASNEARQQENEFIVKCFTSITIEEEDTSRNNNNRRY